MNGPGTPGNRFAEYTVNGSVNVCANIGENPVMTRVAPGSGAGELRQKISNATNDKGGYSPPYVHETKPEPKSP